MNWYRMWSSRGQLGTSHHRVGSLGAQSTVVRRLLEFCPLPIELSVSVTTARPRPGEVPGRDYQFVSQEQFQALRSRNAFLECKEVFGRGDWYGTLRESVEAGLAAGHWVLLEIDVQGAMTVLQEMPQAISFFVHPGSLHELESRLRGRGTEAKRPLRDGWKRLPKRCWPFPLPLRNRQWDVEQSVNDICQLLQQHDKESLHARST